MSEQTARCHWEDCPHGANCVHAVPPAQPPAAPETDVRLSDDERTILTAHFWGRRITANATHLADLIAPAVERIVAERVRVVEGERDEANVHAIECERIGVEAIEARLMETARAESAEAAHRALVAGIEALHVKTPVFQFAEECPNEDHEHSEDENGDPICRECGVVRHECSFCLDDAWDGIHSDWPCAHASLLGGGGAR